ncbi:MAG TPA: biosynthetic-type acetolactate synthase large subunit [Candidatus Omnitrophica bacterium]|nr:MAG: biosynthetic-type acetolactate synthase large subunit [Candidatus Omnitrophota bacterium]RKY35503.1 MAG: biosynthetic-type acetolactate synthase large subunit [Candidatus Omnitrophota bacterium]RKY45058.1 MAG: biosynthetic-type acetolactate synthase large subunit [Candidatus Omnitrophota bacterium]HEC69743.1 biosynthetic-type acetolactate synthase large subunit [Candidatus Omnitrophota bacterium]
MKGAQILIESLLKEKVEVIFGYPGGAVLPLFDKLYDTPIKFILTRHEQAAAHAADGYARSTGKAGVCVATSGPGATNLTTGIATAYMDSVPIIAITGQVKTSLIGNDAFQEADVTGITRSITKHNYLVKDVKDLASTVKEAFYLASSGRPGPVLIDLPVDVQLQETELNYPQTIHLRSYKPTYFGHPGQIKKAAKAIAQAKKPVILAGGGITISSASSLLLEFAEKINTPVITTLMGLGCFPGEHPLYLGMPGMHGTVYANMALTESDLLISIGCRFDDRVTGRVDAFAPGAKIIHVDIDPTSISKNIKVDIPIVGDAKNVLSSLLEAVKTPPSTSAWLKRLEEYKKKYPLKYKKSFQGKIKPQYVVEEIYAQTKGEAIIATEVGQNQMWAAQFYKFNEPRHFLSSGGLGTMGYGFPAAIGAQVGNPERIVFDIAGDGSIQMNIQELATVATYNIPVKIAILNNHYLGMVRQWQELFYKRRYSATRLDNPDFVKVAEGYKVKGMRITKEKDVKKAIKEALTHQGPVVMDFWVEEEENVFPMVPAGEAINRMIGGMA